MRRIENPTDPASWQGMHIRYPTQLTPISRAALEVAYLDYGKTCPRAHILAGLIEYALNSREHDPDGVRAAILRAR